MKPDFESQPTTSQQSGANERKKRPNYYLPLGFLLFFLAVGLWYGVGHYVAAQIGSLVLLLVASSLFGASIARDVRRKQK